MRQLMGVLEGIEESTKKKKQKKTIKIDLGPVKNIQDHIKYGLLCC